MAASLPHGGAPYSIPPPVPMPDEGMRNLSPDEPTTPTPCNYARKGSMEPDTNDSHQAGTNRGRKRTLVRRSRSPRRAPNRGGHTHATFETHHHLRESSVDHQRPQSPGITISNEVTQALGQIQRAFNTQAQTEQLARQGHLADIEARIQREFDARDAREKLREESYQTRIYILEKEVQKLQEGLPKVYQAQQANFTIIGGSPHGPHSRAAHRAADKTADNTVPAGPRTSNTWPESREATQAPNQPPRQVPRQTSNQVPKQAPKQPPKSPGHKKHSFADIAALLTTKPGNKGWQTVPMKPKKARKIKELTPIPSQEREARRLIFRRKEGTGALQKDRADLIFALNEALDREHLPSFLRIYDAGYTKSGALTALLQRGALSSMVLPDYTDLLLTAARQIDPAIIALEASEQWYRLKVHGVAVQRYLTQGLGLARREIETAGELRLKRDPVWLRGPQAIQQSNQKGAAIVITISSLEEARKLRINGLRFGGIRHRTEHYWELGPGTVCPRCCGIGHRSFKACGDRPPKCYICAGSHEGAEHACIVSSCTSKPGLACPHAPAKCGNCGGSHPATLPSCPKRARRRAPPVPPPGPEPPSNPSPEIPEASNNQAQTEQAPDHPEEPASDPPTGGVPETPKSAHTYSQLATQTRSYPASQSPRTPGGNWPMEGTDTPRGTSGQQPATPEEL